MDQLAHILLESFARFSPDWLPTLDDAIEEVIESFEPGRRSRILLNDADDVLGWIGAFEDEHAWEIHPVVVAPDRRRQGFGAMPVPVSSGPGPAMRQVQPAFLPRICTAIPWGPWRASQRKPITRSIFGGHRDSPW